MTRSSEHNSIELSKSVVVRVENNESVSSEIIYDQKNLKNSTKSNPFTGTSFTRNDKNGFLQSFRRKEPRSNCYRQKGKTNKNCCKLEERRYFVLQAIIMWSLLCLPGNIATLYFYSRVPYKNSTLSNSSDLSEAQNSIEELLLFEDHLRNEVMEICQKEFMAQVETEACLDRFADVDQLSKLCDRKEESFHECLSHEMHRLFNSTSAMNSTSSSHLQCYESMRKYNPVIKSARFWIQGVAVLSVGIFGLCGNFITILVLKGTKTNRNFNKLLMGLAVVDSLSLLNMIVEVSIINSLLPPGYILPFWYRIGYPYFFHPTKGMIQTGSIFMVVAISAERYKAVCHPLSHRHAPSKFIVFVIFISITLEIPRFFQFRLITNSTDFYATDFWTTDLMEDPDYIQFSSYWDEMITTGAVPLLALIYFNARMILKIRASSRFSHRFVGNSVHSSARRSTIPAEISSRAPTCKRDIHNNLTSETLLGNQKILKSHSFRSNKSSGRSESPKVGSSGHQRFLTQKRTLKSFSGNSPQKSSGNSSGHFQRRREKSTLILVAIVLIFMACHSYRLALKVYEAAHPENNTAEHYRHCQKQNKYHVPFIIHILMNLSHLFVVLNASTNFIVYCCVGKEFRTRVVEIFCRK